MKRKIIFSLAVLVFIFVTSQLSFAQLINWQRRNPNAPTANRYSNPPAETPAQADTSASTETTNVPTQEALVKENFKVTNQDEELYDANKDGVLQNEEVQAFLKDVTIAVDKKGSFNVSSNILKEYDKDQDGSISRLEAQDIELALR